jgi:hypothetical protein
VCSLADMVEIEISKAPDPVYPSRFAPVGREIPPKAFARSSENNLKLELMIMRARMGLPRSLGAVICSFRMASCLFCFCHGTTLMSACGAELRDTR